MNKDILIYTVFVLFVAGIYILFSRIGYRNIIDNFIYPALIVFVIFYSIIKRERLRTRIKNKKLYSVALSFVLPGLGQAIFAYQWKKLILYSSIIYGGVLALYILLYVGISNLFLAVLTLVIILLMIGFQIYNLVDAYNTGKKVMQSK